jgi:NitT/TauT family transport system permease protein
VDPIRSNNAGAAPGHWDRWGLAAAAVACAAAWEVAARAGAVSSLVFPAPSRIAGALVSLFVRGGAAGHLFATLARLGLGLAAGGLPGVTAGLLMGWSRRLRRLGDPVVAALHPIPKVAILPLVMLIVGIGESSKVLVIAISTFFPLVINTMAGVRQIRPVHYEVAANYHASRWKVLTRVVLPGSLPLILAGTRLAVNVGLVVTIAVELVAADRGLGTLIWFAWETLRTEELYAAVLLTGVLGACFSLLVERLAAWLVPWRPERQV